MIKYMRLENFKQECDCIVERYNKRARKDKSLLYSMATPSCAISCFEKNKKILRRLAEFFGIDFVNKNYLEVGCGTGTNLLQLITWGVNPENIQGCDIFGPSLETAKTRLPSCIKLQEGNFLDCTYEPESFDCVIFSTVFSSILDKNFRSDCMRFAYKLLKAGGMILVYDFVFNNPSNKDVSKVDFKELASDLPWVKTYSERITLAPPLARRLEKFPFLIRFLTKFKILNTHKLCVFEK